MAGLFRFRLRSAIAAQRCRISSPVAICRLILAVAGLSLILGGCTSMKTLEMSATDLQAQIRAGQLIKVGQRVEFVTTDGKEHRFTVTGIDQQVVDGHKESLQIDDIVGLRTREVSAGKTSLLVGGVVSAWVIIAIAIAPAAILAAGAP